MPFCYQVNVPDPPLCLHCTHTHYYFLYFTDFICTYVPAKQDSKPIYLMHIHIRCQRGERRMESNEAKQHPLAGCNVLNV